MLYLNQRNLKIHKQCLFIQLIIGVEPQAKVLTLLPPGNDNGVLLKLLGFFVILMCFFGFFFLLFIFNNDSEMCAEKWELISSVRLSQHTSKLGEPK